MLARKSASCVSSTDSKYLYAHGSVSPFSVLALSSGKTECISMLRRYFVN